MRALEILSKRIGLSDVADLVFDAEQRRKLGGGMHSPCGSAGNARKEVRNLTFGKHPAVERKLTDVLICLDEADQAASLHPLDE